MARIVRHNDEIVREGYIRNGDKEVKLFTRALKAFQCNNRIVMAQRKHLDDFLRGRIIGQLECGRTLLEVFEELGIAQRVISRLWQRFQDDGNKQTEHSIRLVLSALFSYLYDSFKADRVFTRALKAFQCNNRIVMAQRKHLDDFLRGRIIGQLECGRTLLEVFEELGIAQRVISRLWQRFQDDSNVSRCYSAGRPRVTTPNEDRYIYIYIWQLLPKETDGAQHQTCLVSSLQLPVRQFQGRPCTDA
ncbi:uncharacterized protein TNCV_1179451 [Trichonephila clavipes]|nr:uncharacterized protein TNCV_1179451 [Trichonephila clavipes]